MAGPGKLAQHCQALMECRMCRHKPGITPVVGRAAINTSPKVMLVGQAPGQMEAEGGRPFAGRAGKTLFKWLDGAGLDEDTARQKVYIAAVTRCYPGPHPSGRGDRVPSPREQDACAVWLESELRIIRPKLLIPVGKLAIQRFLPDKPLDELIGRAHEVEHVGGKTLAIPLPHPSGASSWIYQGDHPKLLERALRLIGRELRRLGIVPADKKRSVA
ncbi:MAG TPA: uracil-DNA glycosylase [Gemmatimonadaceae bacterium]|jgi:uracil-DNA glycosylase